MSELNPTPSEVLARQIERGRRTHAEQAGRLSALCRVKRAAEKAVDSRLALELAIRAASRESASLRAIAAAERLD